MPLKGIRVVEFAGLAPVPFCGMILSDFGAHVVRVDRADGCGSVVEDTLSRGKRSIAINLKSERGLQVANRLCLASDVVLEPFRPGVMEKLGLSPKRLLAENPAIVYARLTGYGQNGAYKNKAGHDLNYLAISGVLSMMARESQKPTPPVNILADFAGGGLLCAFGIVVALLQRHKTGRGQIIDASMVEGAAYVSSFLFTSKKQHHLWGHGRGRNLLDGGSPLYDTYETKDGKFLAVGCLEPQFAANFLKTLNLKEISLLDMYDYSKSRAIKSKLESTFRSEKLQHWLHIFREVDACVSPVLDADTEEQVIDEHNSFRGSFLKNENGVQPAPAPRLSQSTLKVSDVQPAVGQHSVEILKELGYKTVDIDNLIQHGDIGCCNDKFVPSKL